jgi:predicted P-loop ATPase
MNYNNIPQQRLESSSDLTVKVFDQYYQAPVDVNNNELTAMIGFFESRGFAKDSAESTAIVILKQAKKDKYNPMQILNTLSGLDNVEISGLVAEILNFNRFKTSSLGVSELYAPADVVVRNILP